MTGLYIFFNFTYLWKCLIYISIERMYLCISNRFDLFVNNLNTFFIFFYLRPFSCIDSFLSLRTTACIILVASHCFWISWTGTKCIFWLSLDSDIHNLEWCTFVQHGFHKIYNSRYHYVLSNGAIKHLQILLQPSCLVELLKLLKLL